MSPQELQKRNEKAQQLRVIGVDDETYYVESSEGKICYRVQLKDDYETCTCGDFTKNKKNNPSFKCKHLLSVLGCLASDDVIEGQVFEKRAPKLKEQFLTTIEGKDFVKYPGLLDLGHQKGISGISVKILQYPTKENGNSAICEATVMSKIGETFTDIGDCNPNNCTAKVAKHLIRMASTRSVARALRLYTGAQYTCFEELGDLNDVIGDNKPGKSKTTTRKKAPAKSANTKNSGKKETPKKTQPASGAKDNQAAKTGDNKQSELDQPKMSSAQKNALFNLSRRRGVSVEELENMAMENYQTKLEDLTAKDAAGFIRTLQAA